MRIKLSRLAAGKNLNAGQSKILSNLAIGGIRVLETIPQSLKFKERPVKIRHPNLASQKRAGDIYVHINKNGLSLHVLFTGVELYSPTLPSFLGFDDLYEDDFKGSDEEMIKKIEEIKTLDTTRHFRLSFWKDHRTEKIPFRKYRSISRRIFN